MRKQEINEYFKNIPNEPVEWEYMQFNKNSKALQFTGNCYAINFFSRGNINEYVLINNTINICSTPATIIANIYYQQVLPNQLDVTTYRLDFTHAPNSNLFVARLVPKLGVKRQNLLY